LLLRWRVISARRIPANNPMSGPPPASFLFSTYNGGLRLNLRQTSSYYFGKSSFNNILVISLLQLLYEETAISDPTTNRKNTRKKTAEVGVVSAR
jgi:hypothetical protein